MRFITLSTYLLSKEYHCDECRVEPRTFKEKIKLLKSHGFTYMRDCRHGELWKKDEDIILVPRQHASDDRRASKNWMADFRRAVENPKEESLSHYPILAELILARKYLAMDLDDLIKEHKKLVKILESEDPKSIKKELLEQKKELEHYIELNQANKAHPLK